MLKHIEQALHSLSIKTTEQSVLALKTLGFSGIYQANNPKHVPSNLAELMREAHHARLYGQEYTINMPVWAGACDKTIYTTPGVNLCARAWHDCLHIELRAEFDDKGERAIAEHIRDNMQHILTDLERGLMWTEVVGQLEHLQQFGAFPDDQRAFTLDYINRGYKLGDSFT
jgi:hypothetical protein